MSIAISLPSGSTVKIAGLEVWMGKALERIDHLRPEWDADDVHDVRVALRRCRTMAETLREVNPDPGWRKLKKTSKQLFHSLGDLRDTHVELEWARKLGKPGDPVRKHMLRVLGQREKRCRQAAGQALDAFDRKAWRKLCRKLAPRARFFPLESVVFQRQALRKLNEAVALYQKARKHSSSVAWHRTRIGIKEFRYIVENFLPQRYEVWANDLKQMQDLLGEVHDLDVLRADLRKLSGGLAPAGVTMWFDKIGNERKASLAQFRERASAKNSPWLVWRSGFQWGHHLIVAAVPEPTTAYAS